MSEGAQRSKGFVCSALSDPFLAARRSTSWPLLPWPTAPGSGQPTPQSNRLVSRRPPRGGRHHRPLSSGQVSAPTASPQGHLPSVAPAPAYWREADRSAPEPRAAANRRLPRPLVHQVNCASAPPQPTSAPLCSSLAGQHPSVLPQLCAHQRDQDPAQGALWVSTQHIHPSQQITASQKKMFLFDLQLLQRPSNTWALRPSQGKWPNAEVFIPPQHRQLLLSPTPWATTASPEAVGWTISMSPTQNWLQCRQVNRANPSSGDRGASARWP